MPEKGFTGWKLLAVTLFVVTLVAVTAGGIAVWWARTVVSTSEAQLDVERGNVEAAKGYAAMIKKALDAKTQEAASLQAELAKERQQKDPQTPSK